MTYDTENQASPTERIEALAIRIRSLYILAYRDYTERRTKVKSHYGNGRLAKWDGGLDASGRKYHRPIWIELANFALTHGIDPETLVFTTFNKFMNDGAANPPPPPFLGGPEALVRLNAQYPLLHKKISDALKMQNETMRVQYNLLIIDGAAISDAYRSVLTNRSHELSALYRYCMAHKGNQTDLATEFYEQAFKQYIFKKDLYDELWGDLIPPFLKADSETFRADLAGRQS